MSNKEQRERSEMKNLFADPKFSRQAWQSIGRAILQNPAVITPIVMNKDGVETVDSMIQNYSYNKLCNDIKSLSDEARAPTELEMILQCQIVKARTDTSAAVFVRDTLGAKPIDESKVDQTISNVYEQMTDEELELLAAHRAAKNASDKQSGEQSDIQSHSESLPEAHIIVDTEE